MARDFGPLTKIEDICESVVTPNDRSHKAFVRHGDDVYCLCEDSRLALLKEPPPQDTEPGPACLYSEEDEKWDASRTLVEGLSQELMTCLAPEAMDEEGYLDPRR